MQDDMMFQDLDQLLRSRRQPHVPAGLSERIVAAVARYEEQKRLSPLTRPSLIRHVLNEFVAEIDALFALPRPAFVLPLLLLFGLTLGAQGDNLYALILPGLSTYDLSTFMSIDDRFAASDFMSGSPL